MRSFHVLSVLLLIGSAAVSEVHGAQLMSGDFSFGIGSTQGVGNSWTFTENEENNSATTQGDFTFLPEPSGEHYSSAGADFGNRTLTDGTVASWSSYVGGAFLVPIAANYSGPVPSDVDPLSPDYRLTVEITQLSIYGLRETGFEPPPETMAWEEITAGHLQTSPAVALLGATGPGLFIASNYTQLVWNVPDYSVPLSSQNDSFTRTFQILSGVTPDWRVIDGLEIKGRVILSYKSISEPPSVAGDFDGDGDVDGADFVVWQTNFPKSAGGTLATGDADADGDVDGADFVVWQTHFPTTPAVGATAVPEPVSWMLVPIGVAAAFAFHLRLSDNSIRIDSIQRAKRISQ